MQKIFLTLFLLMVFLANSYAQEDCYGYFNEANKNASNPKMFKNLLRSGENCMTSSGRTATDLYKDFPAAVKEYGKAIFWAGYYKIDIGKDAYKTAFQFIEVVAKDGDSEGENYLGYMYQNGYGVTKDNAEAVKWYCKAAEKGDASAQNNLGYMYQHGEGVTKNLVKAEEFYNKAIEKGSITAIENKASLYEEKGEISNLNIAKQLYVEYGNKKKKDNSKDIKRIEDKIEGIKQQELIKQQQANTSSILYSNYTIKKESYKLYFGYHYKYGANIISKNEGLSVRSLQQETGLIMYLLSEDRAVEFETGISFNNISFYQSFRENKEKKDETEIRFATAKYIKINPAMRIRLTEPSFELNNYYSLVLGYSYYIPVAAKFKNDFYGLLIKDKKIVNTLHSVNIGLNYTFQPQIELRLGYERSLNDIFKPNQDITLHGQEVVFLPNFKSKANIVSISLLIKFYND